MGDTGSLALGGLLGTVAVAVKHEIVLAHRRRKLFVVETLSVIVQVISLKLTGKRVFKMAPIHHHFEQLGWSRAAGRRALLDHRLRAGADRALDPEIEVIGIPVTVFAGQSVAVFGLGGSGFVTAQALVAGGARVNVWDDNEHAREKARAAGLRIENLASADWTSFSALILAPGVPLTHPAPHWTVLKARAAGIEVIGDIELFCRERRKIAGEHPDQIGTI